MNVTAPRALAPQTVTPPAGKALPGAPSLEAATGMRMAAPVFRTFLDLRESRAVFRGVREINGGFMRGSYGTGGVARGSLSTLEGGMRTLPKALSGSFLFSALMSGVTNLIELLQGRKSPMQALGGFCADTVAYTGIGTAATMLGALVGSFVPVVGPLLGVAVGAGISFLLGGLYERKMRPQLSQTFTQSIQGLAAPQSLAPPAANPVA